ncbi:MAG: hypothetical protein KJ063_13495 [Anaerolineae bacterium]|nr:hypothetical protein [Anaerolineae bacterium]
MLIQDDDHHDTRLQRRIISPLPEGVLLRFQAINRGKDPSYNYYWQLHEDGRWFHVWHSGDTTEWQTPFDTPLPDEPTTIFPEPVMHQIREQLVEAQLMDQPRYQQDATVEDGSYYVVTARQNEQVYEIIYEAVSPPLVAFLEKLIHQYGY